MTCLEEYGRQNRIVKRRVGFTAAVLVMVGVLIVVWGFATSGGDLSQGVRIQFEDVKSGSVMVTNVGTVTVAATIWAQVLTNGTWSPPREELFSLPSGVLVGQNQSIPKGAPSGSGVSIRYRFMEHAQGEHPWRVIVLCQRYYPNTFLGQLNYALARYVTRRGSFADRDHRGPADVWIYSETVPGRGATGVTAREAR